MLVYSNVGNQSISCAMWAWKKACEVDFGNSRPGSSSKNKTSPELPGTVRRSCKDSYKGTKRGTITIRTTTGTYYNAYYEL